MKVWLDATPGWSIGRLRVRIQNLKLGDTLQLAIANDVLQGAVHYETRSCLTRSQTGSGLRVVTKGCSVNKPERLLLSSRIHYYHNQTDYISFSTNQTPNNHEGYDIVSPLSARLSMSKLMSQRYGTRRARRTRRRTVRDGRTATA